MQRPQSSSGAGEPPARDSSATSYLPRLENARQGLGRAGGRWLGLATLAAAVACQTVPITGRSAFNAFPPSWDNDIGAQAYEETLAKEKLVTSGPELAMVERAMQRLVAVADDAGYAWEVRLIDNDEIVNAFALPGGKMAVYTGILPVCQDENGLAVVMGHEIGHVVARHGAQRMSQAAGVDLIFQLWNGGQSEELARLAVQYGVELPYGRSHESEADHIGLIYLARAGYDPQRAVEFWQRMAEGSGESPPEFLSTHPSHETRIRQLEELMPEAERERQAAGNVP